MGPQSLRGRSSGQCRCEWRWSAFIPYTTRKAHNAYIPHSLLNVYSIVCNRAVVPLMNSVNPLYFT